MMAPRKLTKDEKIKSRATTETKYVAMNCVLQRLHGFAFDGVGRPAQESRATTGARPNRGGGGGCASPLERS
jgi:hypothetical protein